MSSSNNKLERNLQQARQSGAVPPAVDQSTGQIINPHNPEFLTKKPWYLSGDAGTTSASEPTLEHQKAALGDQDRHELSLTEAEKLLQKQRQTLQQRAQKGKFVRGQWVEALYKNKLPYRICKVLKVRSNQVDLEYEDGTVERRVKLPSSSKQSRRPRVRMTKTGSRSAEVLQATTTTTTTTTPLQTFDSKRDQYHGYDHETHNAKLAQKFATRQALRRQLRDETAAAKLGDTTSKQNQDSPDNDDQASAADSDSDLDDSDAGGSDDSDDEFVQRDEDAKVLTTRLARQGGVGGAQMKVTARNLRIREDTAKYLRNLELQSAYYDPKSRSMRDNPNPEVPAEASEFAGDNFARISGDAVGLADTQVFAWDATKQGVSEIHPQANPSQAELLKKQFKSKAEDLKLQQKKSVLDKYGGQEYLDGSGGLAAAIRHDDNSTTSNNNNNKKSGQQKGPPRKKEDRKLRFGVSAKSEEYGPDGRLLSGGRADQKKQRAAIPSKYEEDVFTNGHSTVWGSYFHRGAFGWGYADDHSLLKNSYCTGENGRIANDEANELRYGTGKAGSAALAQARGLLQAIPRQKRKASELEAAG